jgi:membrane protease YdiL (CAAX protease family)
MALVDHLMLLLLFVVQPLYGAYSYRQYVAQIEAGEPADVLKQYRITMLVEWLAFAGLMIAWVALGRPVAMLGFVKPGGTGFYIGLLLLVAMTAYLVFAWRKAAAATPEERAETVATFGTLRHFMPHDRGSYESFVRLSVTAGIVEETLYRGFAFWYLGQFMPAWAVVAVSALAFGAGHSYQGVSGMIRVTLIGIAFGSYYLLTGSIWLPIVAHVVLDILQGAMLLEYLRERRGESSSPPAATAEVPGNDLSA